MTLEKLLARMLETIEDRSHDEASEQDYLVLDSGLPEEWATAMLATPEGKALAALVEAAVAWHALYAKRFEPGYDDRKYREDADASLDIMRAVDAYLALGDET